MSTTVDIVPTSERQARPLAPFPPAVQREAWTRAVETAPNGKPTAKHVEAAVAEVTGRTAEPPPDRRTVNVMFPPRVNGHAPLPAQRPLFVEPEPEDDGEPEPMRLLTAEEVERQEGVDKFLKGHQKLLGYMCAIDDYGLPRIVAGWSDKQKAATCYSLKNIRSRFDAWISFLEGGAV